MTRAGKHFSLSRTASNDWRRIERHFPIGWNCALALAAASALLSAATPAKAQRSLGIDVSAWQGNLSAATWSTFKLATNSGGAGRDFVFLRSSRGGTTGEDHRQGGYAAGNNTFYDLSQRYDDL